MGRIFFGMVTAAALSVAAHAATMLPMIILTPAQASAIKTVTAGRQSRLDPRLIAAGTYAGKYALPLSVLADPALADLKTTLLTYPETTIDIDEAWPSS